MNPPDLGRVLTAMATPFTAAGSVDFDRAAELAHLLVENGNDGVVVAGTTGESPTLSHDEKLELLRAVRAAIPGKPLVMGTGSNDTRASIELSREALRLGADVVMAVVPYYNRPPQKSLYAHFSAIAAAIDGPLLMYNVPSRTVANLAAETSLRLSQVDNIVALKEASSDLTQCAAVCAGADHGFRVYSGDDSLTLGMMACGAYGVVSVAGHFAAPGIAAMIQAHLAGRPVEAAAIQARLARVFTEVFCTTSPVPTKALFRALGMDLGDTRLPLVMDEITDSQLASLLNAFHELGDLGARLPQGASA